MATVIPVTDTSPAASVSPLLRVILIWLIPSQGRSVVLPAGSRRIPSPASTSEEVPAVPQFTETVPMMAGTWVTVTVDMVLTDPLVTWTVSLPKLEVDAV